MVSLQITAHIISVKNRSFLKPAKALSVHEKIIYDERMAFILDIPYIKQSVGVNSLPLTVGGIRVYNSQNLYSKKTIEKFKVFIGFFHPYSSL